MSTEPARNISETAAKGTWLSGVGAIIGSITAVGTLLLGAATLILHEREKSAPVAPAPESKPATNGASHKPEKKAVEPSPGPAPAPPIALPAERSVPQGNPKPAITTAAHNEKYLDTAAAPVKDKLNFSVFVRLPMPSQINTLQGAVQRSLRQHGDNVVSLFRESFSKEDLDTQLFDGNPTLAKRLELRKYCDKVLLGVVRFSGPPENQNHSGLYMREAILNLHAIAADTGELLDDIEISAKGRGLDEDASTRDALRALEGSVEEKIREWTQI